MSTAQASKRELPHQVTLKVMRLGKPSFSAGVAHVTEVEDFVHGFKGEDEFAFGPSMRLAASFGEIYLGETFACYLTVQNVSKVILAHCGFRSGDSSFCVPGDCEQPHH
jgi:hypothetical protein